MNALSPKGRNTLTQTLISDEGCRLYVYPDQFKFPTIGVGRCLSKRGLTKAECDYLKLGTYEKNSVIAKLEVRGITKSEAEYLLSNDIDDFSTELDNRLVWFKDLPESVKMILINMAFQNGIDGLLKFKKTLALIEQGNYKDASIEMLDSEWSKQTPLRAKRLSKMLASC